MLLLAQAMQSVEYWAILLIVIAVLVGIAVAVLRSIPGLNVPPVVFTIAWYVVIGLFAIGAIKIFFRLAGIW